MTGERIVDHTQKSNKYNCVIYDSYFDLTIGACADLKVRVYSEKGNTLSLEVDCSPTVFTAICISLKLLIS